MSGQLTPLFTIKCVELPPNQVFACILSPKSLIPHDGGGGVQLVAWTAL